MPGLSPEMYQSLAAYGPIIFMVAVFYFALYRPQQKEKQRREHMLNNLKKGDRVITVGGMYGTITALDAKKITLKVAEKMEISFSRTAVQGYQSDAVKK